MRRNISIYFTILQPLLQRFFRAGIGENEAQPTIAEKAMSALSTTWDALHCGLAGEGGSLWLKSNGLVMREHAGGVTVKASAERTALTAFIDGVDGDFRRAMHSRLAAELRADGVDRAGGEEPRECGEEIIKGQEVNEAQPAADLIHENLIRLRLNVYPAPRNEVVGLRDKPIIQPRMPSGLSRPRSEALANSIPAPKS